MTPPRPANRRPRPHPWRPDPDAHTDTACAECPLSRRHDVHRPERVAAYQQRLTDRQHIHAARYDPQEDE